MQIINNNNVFRCFASVGGNVKKKKLIICIVFYFIFAIILYFSGYIFAKKNFDFDNVRLIEKEILKNPAVKTEDNLNVYENSTDYVIKDTKIIIQDYNVETKESTDNEISEKFTFLGMNMSETIEYISRYSNEFKDDNKEILNVVLMSFSKDKVVIRRSYKEIENNDNNDNDLDYTGEIRYYIMDSDGYVTIFKNDKTSIFLNTEIMTINIEEKFREQLKEGIPVKDIYEMYGYLESITS